MNNDYFYRKAEEAEEVEKEFSKEKFPVTDRQICYLKGVNDALSKLINMMDNGKSYMDIYDFCKNKVNQLED